MTDRRCALSCAAAGDCPAGRGCPARDSDPVDLPGQVALDLDTIGAHA